MNYIITIISNGPSIKKIKENLTNISNYPKCILISLHASPHT